MANIELSRPTSGQEYLTEFILDESTRAALDTPRKVTRRVPGAGLTAMSILRDVSYRKTHFRDGAALRSEYTEGSLGGFNQIAIRKIRLPAEAVTLDPVPNTSYPARIIDLSLRKNETSSEPWLTHPPVYFDQEYDDTPRWNCSLYVGRGMVPVLVDQDAGNDLLRNVPGFDSHFSVIRNLVTDLTFNDFSTLNYEEFNDIATAVQSAISQDQDLGETLLECRSIAAERGEEDRSINRAARWFHDAALAIGITYMEHETS